MCFRWFHKWGDWSAPFVVERMRGYGSFGDARMAPMTIQQRVCVRCGEIRTRCVHIGKKKPGGR